MLIRQRDRPAPESLNTELDQMKFVLSPASLGSRLQNLSARRVSKIEIAVDETYKEIEDVELAIAVYVSAEGRVFRFRGDAVRSIRGRDYPFVTVDELPQDGMEEEAPYRSKIRVAERFSARRVSVAEIWKSTETTEFQPITTRPTRVDFVSGYVLFTSDAAMVIEASEFEPSLSIIEDPVELQRFMDDAERLVLIQ